MPTKVWDFFRTNKIESGFWLRNHLSAHDLHLSN